jgi:hypothetical protein
MPLGYFYPKPGLTGQVTINRAKDMPDLCRLSLRALAHCMYCIVRVPYAVTRFNARRGSR